jgi:NAD-dependent deacetylase sirtuin 4
MVYSAFRLAEAAKANGAKLLAINVGPTRADKLIDEKYEVLAGEASMKLASHPSLLLPRI